MHRGKLVRRFITTVLAAMLLIGLVATPASGVIRRYKAGDHAVSWGSSENASVVVDDSVTHDVWLSGEGSAWVKFVIRGIRGRVTGKVWSIWSGDCEGFTGWYRQRGRTLIVKDVFRGELDCTIHTLRVRTTR